jgi:hypothetical protein
MVTRSPEGGDKPGNQVLSDFKILREQRGVGPRTQKPEEPKQQLSDADLEVYKQLAGERWGSTVLKNPIRVRRPNWPQEPREDR